jgi:ABC-type branched-subunit amino acid transport system ATPase component
VPASELPVGEQRLLMVLTAAASGASTLLLDEPSAGASVADASRIADVLAELRREGRAILVVEHNLGVVERIADRVVVLDGGEVLVSGTTDEVAADPRVRDAYLGRQSL